MADPQSTAGTFRTTTLPGADESDALSREARALRELRAWADRGGRVLDLAKLERAGRYLVYLDDHSLWIHSPGEPAIGGRPEDHAVGITDGHGLRWYAPAVDGSGRQLTADAVVERDQAAEQKLQETRAAVEREKAQRRKSPPEHVLTLNDVDHRLTRGTTLRRIVERLEDQGAVVVVEQGAVFVHVARPPDQLVIRLAQLVHRAAPAIVTAVGGKDGAVDPAKLPALELTPGGDPIPSR